MGKYIKVFKAHTDYKSFIESDEYEHVRPNISYCMQESEVHYDENPIDYSKKYLTYEILNDNTNVQITISKDFDTTAISYISYSTDNGNSWTTINNEDGKSNDLTYSFVVNKGDYVMWRAEAQTISTRNSSAEGEYINGCKIQCDDEYNIFGNIMSLLYGDSFYGEYSLIDKDHCFAGLFKNEPIISVENFVLPATTLADNCYMRMFLGCTNLTNAPELPATTLEYGCYKGMFISCTNLTTTPELPATILTQYCYSQMFASCTSLTIAPQLPATTLASGCYTNMFQGCTSLITAPELPATTLASNCYNSMFSGCSSLTIAPNIQATSLASNCCWYMFKNCTSLTTAPELFATTLAEGCYSSMFQGCTSLISAPILPATTLTISCYSCMFYGCTSLTIAPVLPATTLRTSSYYEMFHGCTSLNSITCLATNISATECTSNWLQNVSATGTFTKAASMNNWASGASGIPSRWTIQTANN